MAVCTYRDRKDSLYMKKKIYPCRNYGGGVKENATLRIQTLGLPWWRSG